MSNSLPQPKLPNWTLPNVRNVPTIPNVGCVSGDATTVVGAQMGNFPDIQALPHVKALNKVITEQIGTLLEGKLPDAPRAVVFEARRARLVTELTQIVNLATQTANQIQADVNATINACNEKINDINAAKNEISQLPETVRSAVQTKALERYDEYATEVTGQIGRLQASLGCLA
jgi:hypothetical protein